MAQNDNQTADVGTLLEALRAEVRARRLAQPRQAEDGLQRDLQRALDEIELSRVVSAHWPLLGHNVPTRIVALVNKLVRRYLRWYINPIVEQQNAYNDAVARTLRLLADAYADLAQQTTDEVTDQGSGIKGQRDEESGGQGDKETRRQGDKFQTPKLSALGLQPSVLYNRQRTTDDGQNAIRARAKTEPPARFPDLGLQAQELQLRLRQNVSAHWPLSGRTRFEKAIALVNKLVRRYLRWYINPIVEQQNAANVAVTAALLAFVRLDAERRAAVAARRAAKLRVNSE